MLAKFSEVESERTDAGNWDVSRGIRATTAKKETKKRHARRNLLFC